MTKIQYITEDGKVYPADFIADRCVFVGFNKENKEVYEYYKKGKRCELAVNRFEVSSKTLDLPYGFADSDELKELEI